MRIVAYISGHTGPTYHRITLPLNMMSDEHGVDIVVTNDPTGDFSVRTGFEKGCDIFLWNRVLPDRLWNRLAELKEKYGFRTVCDLDDYWHLDPHHILYDEYVANDFASRQIAHIRVADLVMVSTPELAREAESYNRNVEIVPNAIPRTGQFDIDVEPAELTRLFWQGSITHENDIGILHEPISKLNCVAGKTKMVMAGYEQTEDIWRRMAWIYTAGFKAQYKLIPGCEVLNYYDAYREADICLAPLLKSNFNRYKSNLKVLEAANLGLPVIASYVGPYKDMPVLHCRRGNDWITHVKRLVASKQRQKDTGAEIAEYCNQYYNFSLINNKRKQIFEYEANN